MSAVADVQTRSVLIAGGGIGGLAAALALAKRGVRAHVLEKRAAFSEEGAGIQIGPNGARILQEIGAEPGLIDNAATPDALDVRDARKGYSLTTLPLGDWMVKRFGAPYWTLHRQDLHAALLSAAQAAPLISISTGAAVADATSSAEAVEARLADGTRLAGSALVAADGLWSEIRSTHFRTPPPALSGKSAFRSVVPAQAMPKDLAANNVHILLSPGAHVVHYPVRGGREVAIVAIFEEQQQTTGWSMPVEAAFVRSRVAKLAPQIRALFDAADAWKMWALPVLAVPPVWAKDRCALLGDAAHPVLPFLAQGAVLALEDSAVLAGELAHTDPRDFAGALQRYSARRYARALRVQSASRRNGRIYHVSGMIAAARDGVLRKTPPAILMKQYDWLYGWKASEPPNLPA